MLRSRAQKITPFLSYALSHVEFEFLFKVFLAVKKGATFTAPFFAEFRFSAKFIIQFRFCAPAGAKAIPSGS